MKMKIRSLFCKKFDPPMSLFLFPPCPDLRSRKCATKGDPKSDSDILFMRNIAPMPVSSLIHPKFWATGFHIGIDSMFVLKFSLDRCIEINRFANFE